VGSAFVASLIESSGLSDPAGVLIASRCLAPPFRGAWLIASVALSRFRGGGMLGYVIGAIIFYDAAGPPILEALAKGDRLPPFQHPPSTIWLSGPVLVRGDHAFSLQGHHDHVAEDGLPLGTSFDINHSPG